MPDIVLSEAEFEKLKALVQAAKNTQGHILRVTKLSRPINRFDIEAPVFAVLYDSAEAVNTLIQQKEREPEKVNANANGSGTRPAPKRRS